MTEILIKMVKTDLIIPYEKNTKKHPATQVEQIAKSISNFGFNVPILVDKANVIVTGHARYLAAQKLNLKQVPVAVLEKLTPEQIKKFRLSDNKVAESKWDEVLLIEDLQELKATGYSILDIPGFLEADIDKLLRGEQDDKGNKDPDHVPATKEDHGIKKGEHQKLIKTIEILAEKMKDITDIKDHALFITVIGYLLELQIIQSRNLK